MNRIPLSQRVRLLVLTRAGFKCKYCGVSSGNCELHVDHIVPIVEGGSNDISNLQVLCKNCNFGKRTSIMIPIEHVSNETTTELEMIKGKLKAYKAANYISTHADKLPLEKLKLLRDAIAELEVGNLKLAMDNFKQLPQPFLNELVEAMTTL